MTVKLTINYRPVEAEAGQSVLEAARANGITIPTLCYHKDLSPVGSCRLCMVEVEGWRGEVAACTLPVSEGMVVRTETPALAQTRKTILELLLRNFYDAGYAAGPRARGDRPETEFMRWVNHYGARLTGGEPPRARRKIDSDPNPFVWVDFNKCILCTRCVRACAEVQGRFVWGVAGRGHEARIAAGVDTPMLDARCESCGACAAYCPTGALDDRMSLGLGLLDKKVTTTCPYCGVGCQFDLNVRNGKVIRVTSNPNAPVNGMALCVKGRYGYDFIHHPDRLLKPRVRRYLLDGGRKTEDGGRPPSSVLGRPSDWVEVDWDTALGIAARKLREAREAHGPDSVGILTSAKCLNEENYLMSKFARQVIGTNNIDHCARL
jgi:formate dehydrogenase major subunit/formate dehydrogenase alpha subunit